MNHSEKIKVGVHVKAVSTSLNPFTPKGSPFGVRESKIYKSLLGVKGLIRPFCRYPGHVSSNTKSLCSFH